MVNNAFLFFWVIKITVAIIIRRKIGIQLQEQRTSRWRELTKVSDINEILKKQMTMKVQDKYVSTIYLLITDSYFFNHFNKVERFFSISQGTLQKLVDRTNNQYYLCRYYFIFIIISIINGNLFSV